MLKVKVDDKIVKVKDCRGLKSIRGLMFDRVSKGALITGGSIWMPFVCSKLDLFFLDKEFNVLKRKMAVPMTLNPKTWKSYSCRGARYCLEIRYGIIPPEWENITINII